MSELFFWHDRILEKCQNFFWHDRILKKMSELFFDMTEFLKNVRIFFFKRQNSWKCHNFFQFPKDNQVRFHPKNCQTCQNYLYVSFNFSKILVFRCLTHRKVKIIRKFEFPKTKTFRNTKYFSCSKWCKQYPWSNRK